MINAIRKLDWFVQHLLWDLKKTGILNGAICMLQSQARQTINTLSARHIHDIASKKEMNGWSRTQDW